MEEQDLPQSMQRRGVEQGSAGAGNKAVGKYLSYFQNHRIKIRKQHSWTIDIKHERTTVTSNLYVSTVPKKYKVLKTRRRSSLVIRRRAAGNFLTQNVIENKGGRKREL